MGNTMAMPHLNQIVYHPAMGWYCCTSPAENTLRRAAVDGTGYTTSMHVLRDEALGHTAAVRDTFSSCVGILVGRYVRVQGEVKPMYIDSAWSIAVTERGCTATLLRNINSFKHRSISEIITTTAKAHVVPTAPSVAGALPAETLQTTLNSERRTVPVSSAPTVLVLSAVSIFFNPGVELQAETLGGVVVVSGGPRLPSRNAGVVRQHPLLCPCLYWLLYGICLYRI